jgi:hypothetical protein
MKQDNNYSINTGSNNKKFLGIQIDNCLKWKSHINFNVPKLHQTCFTTRFLLFAATENSDLYVFSSGHDIWDNFSDCNKLSLLQKKLAETWHAYKSSRDFFTKFHTLPLGSDYLLAPIIFIIDDTRMFQTSSVVFKINLGHKLHLH